MRAAFAILAILSVVALAPAASRSGASAAPQSTYEEAPCPMPIPEGQDPDDVVCGYLTAPANRAHDDGRTHRIAVAVLKATGDDHEDDPVVILPGGPAAPQLDFMWDAEFASPIQESRDIVFFDHRGSGYSVPIPNCPEFQTDASYADARHACVVRLLGEGFVFSDYYTAEVASDVVDFLDELGYSRYNLYGASYGTAVAQYMLRDHPERIRSAVLDSNVPLDSDLTADWGRDFEGALDVLFTDCAADPECNAAYPNLEGMYWDVITRANQTPIHIEIDAGGEIIPLDMYGSDIMHLTHTSLYATEFLPLLPSIIAETHAGGTAALRDMQQYFWGAFSAIPAITNSAVNCNDDLYWTTAEEMNAAAAQTRPDVAEAFLISEASLRYAWFECADMGIAAGRDPVDDQPVHSNKPVLILAGDYDPITPPRHSEHVAETMSDSSYFLFRGTGHGAIYNFDGCALSMMVEFLDTPNQLVDSSCMDALGPPDFVIRELAAPTPVPTSPPLPPPAPTAPSGVITAPDTGSGSAAGDGMRAGWFAAVTLIAAGFALTAASRKRRR